MFCNFYIPILLQTLPQCSICLFYTIPENETWFDKVRNIIETIWVFTESILVSITRHLMKYSRDYRYISKTLSIEKKALKVISLIIFFMESLCLCRTLEHSRDH